MQPFETVPSARVGRSVFNLSYSRLFDADMGLLYPVMCDEVVPGDVFDIQCEDVIRFNPLVAPLLHEVNLFVHYFFVPYRILWDGWEEFITGGVDGDDASVLPVWDPDPGETEPGWLWDAFAFPNVPGGT